MRNLAASFMGFTASKNTANVLSNALEIYWNLRFIRNYICMIHLPYTATTKCVLSLFFAINYNMQHEFRMYGTGPGVRRVKHPLLASYIRRKCSMESSRNLVKGRWKNHGLVKSLIDCNFIWPSFECHSRKRVFTLDKIPAPTKELLQLPFQYLDVFLIKKLIGK